MTGMLDVNDPSTMILLLTMGAYLILRRRRKFIRWVNRRWYERPINRKWKKMEQGDFQNLLQEIKDDETMFFRYTRMTLPVFKKLLNMIKVHLTKPHWRALPAEQRLFITLRYLATGDTPLSIAVAHRIGESTVYKVVRETCDAIVQVLSPIYLRCPTEDEWIQIIEGFWNRWNFPNCFGAVDGKHIPIIAPHNSGSLYYNYKKFFSVVLLAMCDHKYKFTLVDVGAYGSNHDGGIFENSAFGEGIKNGTVNIPPGEGRLYGSNARTPFFSVGDETFALSKQMMRPYLGVRLSEDKLIFNYRLSRARRTIENAFGILTARWRILSKPLTMHPKRVDGLIWACLCLYNYLITENDQHAEFKKCPDNFVDYETPDGNFTDGLWRKEAVTLKNIRPTTAHHAIKEAYDQRDLMKEYLRTPQEALNDDISWLICNVEPIKDVTIKWIRTFAIRLWRLKQLPNISDYFEQYYILKSDIGYEFILFDYGQIYPNNRNNLKEKWPNVRLNLIAYAKAKVNSLPQHLANDLFSIDSLQEDQEDALILYILPSLLKGAYVNIAQDTATAQSSSNSSTPIKKRRVLKKRIVTAEEARKAFITIAPNVGEADKIINDNINDLNSRGLPPLQSFIIFIGAMKNIEQTYAIINNIK